MSKHCVTAPGISGMRRHLARGVSCRALERPWRRPRLPQPHLGSKALGRLCGRCEIRLLVSCLGQIGAPARGRSETLWALVGVPGGLIPYGRSQRRESVFMDSAVPARPRRQWDFQRPQCGVSMGPAWGGVQDTSSWPAWGRVWGAQGGGLRGSPVCGGILPCVSLGHH